MIRIPNKELPRAKGNDETVSIRLDIERLQNEYGSIKMQLDQLKNTVNNSSETEFAAKTAIEQLEKKVAELEQWVDFHPIPEIYSKTVHLSSSGAAVVADQKFCLMRRDGILTISSPDQIVFTPGASSVLSFGPLPPGFECNQHFVCCGVLDAMSNIRNPIGCHISDDQLIFYRLECSSINFARAGQITIYPFSVSGIGCEA